MSTQKQITAGAAEINTTNKTWYAVTVHESDGHPINGKFYTDDIQTVKDFCWNVNPLTVTMSRHPSEFCVLEFLVNFDENFDWIDLEKYSTFIQLNYL